MVIVRMFDLLLDSIDGEKFMEYVISSLDVPE